MQQLQPPSRPASRKGPVIATVAVLVVVALTALVAKGCQAVTGGPVGSTDDFRAYVRSTTKTGEDVYRGLSPAPRDATPYPTKEGSSSCVDDFGFDTGDTTRDQPAFTWSLEYATEAGYRSAVAGLARRWRKEGRDVEEIPAPGPGEKGAGLPGVSAAFGDGIEVSVRPGWYSGKPELRVEGRCFRYEDTYGDAYDYMDDDNGDGVVDDLERSDG
ncbi:hypothetical protein [Streptomyces sp. VRA16 Mangrove soil]|uniref:hypothetical protein n=1 Tax=Streptomyces sp. VRA16 Mangrove soil TaxID=2817434 RepID=UPI001A9D8CCC|nr:hypothetical protein [Streptomyces sp. VRA16 Mangrove soil]MBO1337766.1 hypothetical protein [Streptomyces sp. VRA16 Mangrove soil]